MGKIIKGYFEEDYSLVIEDDSDAEIVKSRIFFHDEEPPLTEEGEEEAPEDYEARGGAVVWRHVLTIGFAGKKRSGKDAAAQIARGHLEEAGWVVHTISFADALREYALKLNPWVVSDYEDPPYATDPQRLSRIVRVFGWEGHKDTSYAESVREALQRLGTDVMRAVDEDVWVRLAARKVQEILKDNPDGDLAFIFTDVRFENEAQFILAKSGAVFEMCRPGLNNEDSHASESLELEPNGINIFRIENDDTVQALGDKVLDALIHSVPQPQVKETRP